MPRSLPLRQGCAYGFHYPRHNYSGLPPLTEPRRVIVETVRDTRFHPLEAGTLANNPLLRRGRWLVTGYDLDRNAQRSFYVDSMSDIQPLSRDEREPYRDAQYVVLTSVGRAMYQSSRLAEAMNFLIARPAGILCKVLGMVERQLPGDSSSPPTGESDSLWRDADSRC